MKVKWTGLHAVRIMYRLRNWKRMDCAKNNEEWERMGKELVYKYLKNVKPWKYPWKYPWGGSVSDVECRRKIFTQNYWVFNRDNLRSIHVGQTIIWKFRLNMWRREGEMDWGGTLILDEDYENEEWGKMSKNKQRIRKVHENEDIKVGFEEEKGWTRIEGWIISEREKEGRRGKKKEEEEE